MKTVVFIVFLVLGLVLLFLAIVVEWQFITAGG